MALKIRGESEFVVSADRDVSEILAIARQVMEEFRAVDDAILSAEVAPDGADTFQISIVLRAASYAHAEDTMTRLSTSLTEALVATATSAQAGATELVPA